MTNELSGISWESTGQYGIVSVGSWNFVLPKFMAKELVRRCKDYEGLEKALVKLLNMGNAGEGCATCHLQPTNLCDCATEKKEVILQALEALTEAIDA